VRDEKQRIKNIARSNLATYMGDASLQVNCIERPPS